MACETQCCVLSRGEVYIKDLGDCEIPEISCETDGKGFRKLGNVLSCQIQNISEIIGKQNKHIKTNDICARKTILGVNINLTIGCASKENLILALSNESELDESGSGDDRYCIDKLKKCLFFPFSNKGVDFESLTIDVLDIENESIEELALGEDFSVDKSGITLLKDLEIEDAVTLKITYDFVSSGFSKINLSDKLGGYKSLYFKGVNYSDGGESLFDAEIYKVLLNPTDNIDLINQTDFLTLNLTGIVEKVKGKNYYNIQKQE